MSEFDYSSEYQDAIGNAETEKYIANHNWLGRLKPETFYMPDQKQYDPQTTPTPDSKPVPKPNPPLPNIVGNVAQEVKNNRAQKYSNWATWITYVFFVGVIVAIIFKLFSSYRDVSIG